ncbi:hypothetical protein D5086_023606 [Populus alba]
MNAFNFKNNSHLLQLLFIFINAFNVKIVTVIVERKEGKRTDRLPFGTIQNAASWRSMATGGHRAESATNSLYGCTSSDVKEIYEKFSLAFCSVKERKKHPSLAMEDNAACRLKDWTNTLTTSSKSTVTPTPPTHFFRVAMRPS